MRPSRLPYHAMQNLLDMQLHVMQVEGMTFDQFLSRNGISNSAAAARLGRDVTLIGRYRQRAVNPSPEVMAEICEWSKGKCSPRELLAVREQAA